MRNEAHRFSLAHHRNMRSKAGLHSELDEIIGIGPKSKTDLLKTFKSIKRIKDASLESLTEILGASKAQKLNSHFHDRESKS